MNTQNTKNIILMQTNFSIGGALIGIFFPFILAKAFSLSNVELLIFWGIMWLVFGLTVAGINILLLKKGSPIRNIQISLIFSCFFYTSLSLGIQSTWLMILSLFFFMFSIATFWPSLHYLILHSVHSEKRGTFAGHIQMILVGVNIVSPIISGFLMQLNKEKYIIFLSLFFFLLAFFFSKKINLTNTTKTTFQNIKKAFYKNIWKTDSRFGFITDGIQSGFLMIAWPLYLKKIVVNFSIMGIVTSLSACAEIIFSYFLGKRSDKMEHRKIIKQASIARLFDIGIRALYIKFSSIFFVGFIQILNGALGPLFNIPFNKRVWELGEKTDSMAYFLARETLLGIVRGFTMITCGLVVFYAGELALAWVIIVIALLSLSYRKF